MLRCWAKPWVEAAGGAGEGDVKGVDEELVDLQRLVFLVAGAAVGEFIAGQVGLVHALDDVAEGLAVAGNKAVEHDVFVLQALGFVDGEQQRSGEALAGGGFVFVTQHQYGEVGGAAAVAEIGAENGEILLPGKVGVAPEEALDLAPREEVGVYDLVRIATQQEVAGFLLGGEHQGELRRGELLHFVHHHHEVVTRSRPGAPGLGDEVEVVQPGFVEPDPVFLEQVVQVVALGGRKD